MGFLPLDHPGSSKHSGNLGNCRETSIQETICLESKQCYQRSTVVVVVVVVVVVAAVIVVAVVVVVVVVVVVIIIVLVLVLLVLRR